ncbi:MAG: hypothetical protein J5501_02780 [Ruminococcus sp.]|nr:hypothetical protein [Ruminococcus sp.]
MKRLAEALGPLLIVIIGLSVFFQGLPWQFRVKDDYGSLKANSLTVKDTMKEEDIPEGWKEYSIDGIAFWAPPGLRYDETESAQRNGTCYTDDDTSVTVFKGTEKRSVDECLIDTGLTAADLRWFCTRTLKPYPLDEFEFLEMCAELSPTDLDIHSYKQSRIFYALLELCPQLYDPLNSFRVDIIKDKNTRMYATTFFEDGKDPYILVIVYTGKRDKVNVCICTGSTGTDMEIATSLHSAEGTTEET